MQNPANKYAQPVPQGTHLENQSLSKVHLPNVAAQAEQLSTTTNNSITKLFNHQQAIQRDTYTLISKFSYLQVQNKNDHFLSDLHLFDGKGVRSFLNWITQVKKIPRFTECLEIQMTQANAEGIVYKCINDMLPHQH